MTHSLSGKWILWWHLRYTWRDERSASDSLQTPGSPPLSFRFPLRIWPSAPHMAVATTVSGWGNAKATLHPDATQLLFGHLFILINSAGLRYCHCRSQNPAPVPRRLLHSRPSYTNSKDRTSFPPFSSVSYLSDTWVLHIEDPPNKQLWAEGGNGGCFQN